MRRSEWQSTALCAVLFLFHVGSFSQASPELIGRWGKSWYPSELVVPQTKYLGFVTLSTACPLGQRILPSLNKIQKKYQARGVQLIALFPNVNSSLPEITNFATEMDIHFPIFKDDPTEFLVDELGLSKTPEIILLDVQEGYKKRKVLYQGALDDSLFAGGSRPGDKTETFLVDAIEEALAGKEVSRPETATTGCAIVRRDFSVTSGKRVTYYRDVAPIIQNKCQQCHQDGEVAGNYYTFDTYDDVASNFETIRHRITNGIMPPWHAYIPDPKHGGFKEDARLSDEELATLLDWEAQGFVQGNKSDAPPKRTWPKSREWRIGGGEPDFVFEMPEPYHVPIERLDDYQYFTVPMNFPEDRWIQAIQLRPGNPLIVHHIAALVAPHSEREFKGLEAMVELYGLSGDNIPKIGDFVPGDPFNARTWPEGQAMKLPAGTDIQFELHYTPTGKEEDPDVSSLGIVWADGPPKKLIENKVMVAKKIAIPPHEGHYRLERYFSVDEQDIMITATAPHMHFRGKDYELYKVYDRGTPKERKELIMRVPAYDFNWQRTYELEKPLSLKAGEYLYAVVHFDNSAYNPGNPDPSQLVRWGLKSENEMFNVRFKYYRVNEN